MALRVLCTMFIVLLFVLAVCNWSPHTAYRVLHHSQNLFESDEQTTPPPVVARAAGIPPRRGYISPLVKKRVAAVQKWRCASCKSLLDETYEIDHIKPLFKHGNNAESNLQALCRRCHASKSAIEQRDRAI